MLLALSVACLGCEPAKPKAPAAPPAPIAAAPEIAAPAFAPPPLPEVVSLKFDPRQPADTVREVASSAQTAKGKYEVDLITQPVSAYFTVKDQVVFNVQIPKAMQLYELAKNRKPATHEEFMDVIITKNGIKLPDLPPTYRYVYDPKLGELLVERPKE